MTDRHIEDYTNGGSEAEVLCDDILAEPGVRILRSTFAGPAALRPNVRVGPDVQAGVYLQVNRDGFIANATIGNYCTFGARTAVNPFNHPHEWLSSHEFQYHRNAFGFSREYREFERLPYSEAPGLRDFVKVGHDVWIGHNANVMANVEVGNGSVIAAGAVVTHDVPAYAIVAGVPARVIRFRFDEATRARLLAVEWWNLPFGELSGLPFNDVHACLEALEQIRSERAASGSMQSGSGQAR